MAIKYDNCKDCYSRCVHAGKDREFICINGVSCKIIKEKPKTHADRIRAMSDAELAKVLNAFAAYFEACNRSSEEVECKDCEMYRLCGLYEGEAMEWLKQPAEV